MTDLTTAGAGITATGPQTAAELAARIPVPTSLPIAADGEPLRHLSATSYQRWLGCPESWRRYYLKGERPAPSGSMFLGSRVDDALSAYHRWLPEHGDRLSTNQVLDIYRELWAAGLEDENDKQGVNWEDDLSERQAFELGGQAVGLALSELVPHLGDPVDVQRQLRGVLARLALAASQILACYERYGPDQPWGFADPTSWRCSPRFCHLWASCPGGRGL